MKALIIEDDVFFQKFYANKLTENGFEVQTAADGEDGIAKIVAFKPDVVLLDLIMPKKDGFEVLKDLSSKPGMPRVPVIIFSSLGQEQDVQKAKQLGAADFINKSVSDVDVLLAKIFAVVKANQST